MKVALAAIFSARNLKLLTATVIALCAFAVAPAQDEPQTGDAVRFFNQGQDAHEKGDLQTALKFYDQALKSNPEFPEAEYQRGAIFVALGKTDDAEKAFRHALELREDWTLPMTELGIILVQKNNYTEAEKFLTKAVEGDEPNTPAYAALAELYRRSKPAPEILKNFLTKLQTLTANSKSNAALWTARGIIELALQDKSAALQSFNNALQLKPNDEFALAQTTEIFLSQNDFARASETAERLVRTQPNSPNAKFLLARVYAQSGKAADALKILDGLDAANADVQTLRNSLVVNSAQDTAALEKELEKNSKNVDILSRLCVLMRVSNPPKALDYCRRAAELEPNNLQHYIAYGAALVQARQFDNAVSLFRKVLQVAPENYTAHANLATALFESKRFPEAKVEYEWLTHEKSDLAIAYYFLAITHDQLGEFPEALENYRKFLSLADDKQNRLEIDKVNLRLPSLEKAAKQKGKK